MMTRTRIIGVVALASTVVVSGCARGCTSSRPPIHLNPSMDNQPKLRPQAASPFFYNGAGMREPVPGTVAIDGLKEGAAQQLGSDRLLPRRSPRQRFQIVRAGLPRHAGDDPAHPVN